MIDCLGRFSGTGTPFNINGHKIRLEKYLSIFKRGMKGVYQHCAKKHLYRYLAEFDFRYNNRVANGMRDEEHAEKTLKGFEGKRLTYRNPNEGIATI
jgi:hypothetical protein